MPHPINAIATITTERLLLLSRLLAGKRLSLEKPAGNIEELAECAGVLELLGRRSDMAERFPRARQAYLAQAALGMMRLEALREIAGAMRKQSIDIIPLKGMAYALMFEPGGPVRSMADIDILVRTERFEEAAGILLSLGYVEFRGGNRVGTRWHHERQFTRDRQMVELHRAFLSPGRISIDYRKIWSRAIAIEQDGVRCLRLYREDTFLYHCFHMALHEFSVGGLRQIVELDRLLKDDRPDLELAARRAIEWGVRRMLFCSLRLYQICYPESLPEETLDLFRPHPVIVAILEKLVIAPSAGVLLEPGLLFRPVQLVRKALMVEGPIEAMRYFLWYLAAEAQGRMIGKVDGAGLTRDK